jgi:hypothetical protein
MTRKTKRAITIYIFHFYHALPCFLLLFFCFDSHNVAARFPVLISFQFHLFCVFEGKTMTFHFPYFCFIQLYSLYNIVSVYLLVWVFDGKTMYSLS